VRRQGRSTSSSGQVTAEFALIVGAIAVGCIVGILFLSNGINSLFQDPAQHLPSGQPFTPPVSPPAGTYPTTVEQCRNGGWRDFAGFTSEADCESYVTSHAGP
jgi:Flp pilus assembly pilin Flp